MFYILAIITSISHIILYVILTVQPNSNPFIYAEKGFHLCECMELIGSMSMLALGWLVLLCVFELYNIVSILKLTKKG